MGAASTLILLVADHWYCIAHLWRENTSWANEQTQGYGAATNIPKEFTVFEDKTLEERIE